MTCGLCCRQDPNEPCSLAALRKLGVLAWKLDADNHETDPRLAAIRKVRNYSYVVSIQQTSGGGWEVQLQLQVQLWQCSMATRNIITVLLVCLLEIQPVQHQQRVILHNAQPA